jgi:hypothetical protein
VLKKLKTQIPRGLKSARDDKKRACSGTAKAVPFQSGSKRLLSQLSSLCATHPSFARGLSSLCRLQAPLLMRPSGAYRRVRRVAMPGDVTSGFPEKHHTK